MNEIVAEMKDRMKEALYIREKKAADLAKDLNIPKSAISQYLSGASKNMDSRRMSKICTYLNVSVQWMMGFNVPMEPNAQKNSDIELDTTVLSENQKLLIEFAKSVPEDRAAYLLRVMKSILEDEQ